MPKANDKDVYYFSHDCNARNDDKILALRSVYGLEGYAIYFMLIEILREQPTYKLPISKYTFNTLAMQMQSDSKRIELIVNDCCTEFVNENSSLLTLEDGFLYSESLLRRMEKVDNTSESRTKAANIRWEKEKQCKSNANAEQKECNKKRIDKKKKEEKKGEETIKDSVSAEPSLAYDIDSTEYLAVQFLIKSILNNNPNARVPSTDVQINNWCDAANKILRIDKKPVDEFKRVLQFATTDNFWSVNILSMGKFRDKYDQLYLKMNSKVITPKQFEPQLTGAEKLRLKRLKEAEAERGEIFDI